MTLNILTFFIKLLCLTVVKGLAMLVNIVSPSENAHPLLHCLRIFHTDVIYADLNIRLISKVIKELAHNFDRN